MPNLIGNGGRDARPPSHGARRLVIDGIEYANSAAKFWPNLLDEARAEVRGATHVELEAPVAGKLDRGHLFPEQRFARDLEKLLEGEIESSWRETLAELDIVGPPAAVVLRVLSGTGEERLARDLPLDALDADLFPYLAVWLLEWAGVHPGLWNREEVRAAFSATDPDRDRRYDLQAVLTRRHVSEGLYLQTVRVAFDIRA